MMMDFSEIKRFLKEYNGPGVKLMEICGSHTASIAHNGIRDMLSPKIRLVSGPGCPVCVTSTSFVDKLCNISRQDGYCIASFGDMLRVTGSNGSLFDAKATGGSVLMLYSPLDLLKIARENPNTIYVFAAVGFETTAPVYAVLLERIIEQKIKNVKLLTALKTMPPVLEWLCAQENDISGFIAPGHVSVITGPQAFKPLAEKYNLPFAITGFEGRQILESLYLLIKKQGVGDVFNLYTSVVKNGGNAAARAAVSKYFKPGNAAWRGMGKITNSGLYLKPEYSEYDSGSLGLDDDIGINKACRCSEVLMGRLQPPQCPLFGKVCIPQNPAGACMVSNEGACGIWFNH